MDWFTWLSKTGLEQSLVYEYGLAFCNNELEEEDIAHFNHEFLQSMGISIAKHRLEILKLARKETRGISPHPVSRLLLVIKRTKRSLEKYVRTWVRREESAALMVVPRPGYGSRLRGAMLKRNKRLAMARHGRLMLTNGSPFAICTPRIDSVSSPMVQTVRKEEGEEMDEAGHSHDLGYGYTGFDEFRWDTMFQDLKPT